MTINFEKVSWRYRRLIKKIYEKAAEETQNNDMNIVLSVTFVNEGRIRELNKVSRNIDSVTDVLSFPMLEIKYPQKIQEFDFEENPDGTIYIGDVVICVKRAKEQAKEYGHSLKREIGFLALHGLLHVLGYDHIEKNDEKIMSETANKILDQLDLKRGENV